MSWNPEQYLKFSQPRLRPALDLLARVDSAAPERVCDLGCGTGNVTRILGERWPAATLTGIDASGEMLAQAAKDGGAARFIASDLAGWAPDQPVDVIYSNAALHWVSDHAQLLPKLVGYLAPRGVLALQMPRNFSAPSHQAMHATALAGPWRKRLEHLVVPPPVKEPEFYYGVLQARVSGLELWETEYLHVLEGEDPVKEWTKGTWLSQFLGLLDDPAERAAFERDYAARVRQAYPPREDGKTLFPFRRLFIVAKR